MLLGFDQKCQIHPLAGGDAVAEFTIVCTGFVLVFVQLNYPILP